MERLALFISGGGTTAEAILTACKPDGQLENHINPVLVVASKPDIKGIERALNTGMITDENIVVLERKKFETPEAYGQALIKVCKERHVTLFGQYGWLVKTPENFLQAFPRGINQHPAPLCPGKPDFGGDQMYGRRCHLARLLFVRMTQRNFWTAAVAHRVYPEYDKGPVVWQQHVPILKNDTVETLQARVLPIEHQVQIGALKDFATAQVDEIACETLVEHHEMSLWYSACEAGKMAYPQG